MSSELYSPQDAATFYFNRTSPTTQTLVSAMKKVALEGLGQQAWMHFVTQELKAGRYEVHEGRIRPKSRA